MYTTAGRNAMLDELASLAGFVAAHTAWPGATGASNEVTGGDPAYARKAITWNAAGGGLVVSATQPILDIPALTDVYWLSIWSAVSAGTCYGLMPAGGTPMRFWADAVLDLIHAPAHGFLDDDTVVFWGGTLPTGLTEGTVYYVVSAMADDFQVAATLGGYPVELVSAPSGQVLVSLIEPEPFAAQGTLTVTSLTLPLDL